MPAINSPLYNVRYITMGGPVGQEQTAAVMATGRVAGVEALLRPRSVVVIGASAKSAGSGNAVLANIRNADWQADVHVVHPTAARIDGVDAVPTVADLPYGIDAALLK